MRSRERRYQMVSVSMWDDPDFRAMVNGHEDARHLFLYFLTCKHLNLLGLFVIPKAYAMRDLNWSAERIEAAFADPALARFAILEPKSEVVLLPNRFKHNPLDTPNKLKGAVLALNEVPKTALDAKLLEIIIKMGRGKEYGLLVDALRMRCGSNTHPELELEVDSELELDTDTEPQGPRIGEGTPARYLSRLLLNRIRETDPKAKEPNWDAWDLDMDRLMRIDGRSEAEIAFVVNEAQDDEFWRPNILSPKKLREKFGQLWIKFRNPKRQRTTRHEDNLAALRRAQERAEVYHGEGQDGRRLPAHAGDGTAGQEDQRRVHPDIPGDAR